MAVNKANRQQRDAGRYYTPVEIVRFMIRSTLGSPNHRPNAGEQPLRILDPACGDGAFLLELFDWFIDRQKSDTALTRTPASAEYEKSPLAWQQRLNIIDRHLFGVDIDRAAVNSLQEALFARVAPPPESSDAARQLIATRIVHGNSLTGDDFSRDRQEATWTNGDGPPEIFGDNQNSHATDTHDSVPAINWHHVFPQVAQSGGFDLILGNPPYRRELNFRSGLERIANSPLGKRWRQPRMDFWYYFFHRSLDLLRPGGMLSFIVNSYWTASTGAQRMIERLKRETALEEVVLLGGCKIFADVAGRHLILRLRKTSGQYACRVIDLSSTSSPESLLHQLSARPNSETGGQLPQYRVPYAQLYSNGQLVLHRPDAVLQSLRSRARLGDRFEVRQGIAENPPNINARLHREFAGKYRLGEGVFVLTADEVESLKFNDRERNLLRPYYSTRQIGRYEVPPEPERSLLYLTRESAATLEGLPNIRRHLERFVRILERRREVKRGVMAWWHLHWPREERLFTLPRILSVQMGHVPQFAYVQPSTFVGFSVNVILSQEDDEIDLACLCGILNSELGRRWFERHAKKRGVNLEINGKVLRQFPLPNRNSTVENRIRALVLKRQPHSRVGIEDPSSDHATSNSTERLESQIDKLVREFYGI